MNQLLIIIFGLIILTLLFIIVFLLVKNKKSIKQNIKKINGDLIGDDNFNNLDLKFFGELSDINLEKMLPSALDKKPNEESLVKIEDKQLIATVDNYVSNSVKVSQNLNIAKQVTDLSKNIVQVNIPIDDLHHINSEQVRFFVKGNNKFVQNAIGTKVDLSKVQATNMVNAAMGVGSMVVGQYYMKTISDKMESLESSVDKISMFQDEEYKAKVLNIIRSVQEMTKFEYEIMKNDTIRNNKIHELSDKKDVCKDLLGQANIHINNTLVDCKNLRDYESKTKDIKEWREFQQILTMALQGIAKLENAFYLGHMSMELSINTYCEFIKDTNNINELVMEWHIKQQKVLSIDIDRGLKQRDGIKPLWKLINKEYKPLDENIVYLIKQEMNVVIPTIEDKTDRFRSNVAIIKDGNDYYYLLEDNK